MKNIFNSWEKHYFLFSKKDYWFGEVQVYYILLLSSVLISDSRELSDFFFFKKPSCSELQVQEIKYYYFVSLFFF